MEPVTVRATEPAPPGDPMLNRTETVHGEPDGIGDLVHRLIEDANHPGEVRFGANRITDADRGATERRPL